ncbi:hypothetical protein EHF33_01610 [Deinococcus psychrotolerans]|uniref:Uncharacterized protein n=1 Tax=Deinococcus psychrotolerans TaxID=2489213 RepID=A0A3G8Y8B2_9DEIO|nr:hypothetical protein [Deinococcus psychrotolerans]AZI41612.1 hypothetical protein EHF33_01610 [Deinococcus psychrotolerans]
MNGPVLLRLILEQGERWVIWKPGDLSADVLVCQAGRLAAFTDADEAQIWAAAKNWTLTIGNTCDFTAVLRHLRGEQLQADASALLGIWNLSMDLAEGLLKPNHPVLSRSVALDRLHDQLTALAMPWSVLDQPPQRADLDGGVLEQLTAQATSLFERQLSAALQA